MADTCYVPLNQINVEYLGFFLLNLYILLFSFNLDRIDNKLFDAVSELKHEIFQITVQNEKLRQESYQLQGSPSDAKASEKSTV